ncbi:hypothetical protein L1887_47760 [Cichorium endivia]|nr:hypothetical protein L1887_47760 [Cichorium endivia]
MLARATEDLARVGHTGIGVGWTRVGVEERGGGRNRSHGKGNSCRVGRWSNPSPRDMDISVVMVVVVKVVAREQRGALLHACVRACTTRRARCHSFSNARGCTAAALLLHCCCTAACRGAEAQRKKRSRSNRNRNFELTFGANFPLSRRATPRHARHTHRASSACPPAPAPRFRPEARDSSQSGSE